MHFRCRRAGLSYLYYTFVGLFAILGVLFAMAAFGSTLGPAPWSEKWQTLLIFGLAALSWPLGIPSMWSAAKSYARNEVRLEDGQFFLRTPAGTGLVFALADVTQVSWNPGLRSRQCTVVTPAATYRFDTRLCPRVAHVARLIAEHSGRPLQIVK